ncbi:hypothetical protein [Vibrio breoganii]|uniref:hypothetical protein n=1 Tax=Vibrio breoganii TaxID=553239 RepID=UPI000C826157|nr:hypothetical protein [Vibrio breoganii]
MCPNCIESICSNRCVRPTVKPLFGIVWHYEGESPTLFTCNANSLKAAETKFEAEMSNTELEAEYYIDSVHQIER